MFAIICHGFPANPQISALQPSPSQVLPGNPSTSAGRADGDMGIIEQGDREPASRWRFEVLFFLYEAYQGRSGAEIGYLCTYLFTRLRTRTLTL